ncbi:unnamed protein product [Sphagnum balticum]
MAWVTHGIALPELYEDEDVHFARNCRNEFGYQFVPQLLFLNSLFGYLSFLILLRWCQGSKPDFYHIMIYMFLRPTEDLGENKLFESQTYVQLWHHPPVFDKIVLFITSLIAVPWMLLPKPLALRSQYLQKLQGRTYGVLSGVDNNDVEDDGDQHEEEELEFSEVLVHQVIHTIEFELGAVSNTASY